MDPGQVRVVLVPLDALGELEPAVGGGGGEGGEEVLAAGQPEEGLLQDVGLLLPQVRAEVHLLAQRAPVLRLHLLRDRGRRQSLEITLDVLENPLDVQVLLPDMVEQVLHVDPDLGAGPRVALLEGLHVGHGSVAQHQVRTALDDVAGGRLGRLQLLLDEILGVVPAGVVDDDSEERVFVADDGLYVAVVEEDLGEGRY